jgi:Domain of unknown function (DUF4397)
MLHRNWLFVSAACLAPLAIFACSSDEGTPAGAGGSAGATSDGSATDGASGAAQGDAAQDAKAEAASEASVVGDAEAGAPLAFVRVANLSPGVTALDICVRPRTIVGDGGSEASTADAADSASDGAADASDAASDAAASGFVGPILKNAGIPTGLAYGQVTAYLPIATAAYDVRVVAANAASCAIALDGTPDAMLVSAVAAGSYSTFAAIGLTTPQTVPAFQVKAYTDDHTVTAGQTKLRFIHASPGTPNLDLGLSTGESFVPLFGNVAYSEVGTGATGDAGVDTNGYLAGPPITSQTLVVRLTGDPTDVVAGGLTLPAGAIASTFAIGVVASVTTPVKLLICQDLDTSKAPLSNCVMKP